MSGKVGWQMRKGRRTTMRNTLKYNEKWSVFEFLYRITYEKCQPGKVFLIVYLSD